MAENNGNREAVKVVQTAGRDMLGNIASEFARLNDDVLFGEVWSRNDKLSLPKAAKKNGITAEEMDYVAEGDDTK